MPKWKDAGAGIVVTNDDDDEQDGNRSDRENERPADNTMNSPLPSPVANWKYSAARAYENLNQILADIKLLGGDVDIRMTPRLAGSFHTAVVAALSDGGDAISPVGGGERRGEETENDGRREENEESEEMRHTEEKMRKQWEEEAWERKKGTERDRERK